MIPAEALADARRRILDAEQIARWLAESRDLEQARDVAAQLADRLGDVRAELYRVAAVPRCTAPECSRPLPPQVGPGPRRRYCSGRCKKRAARAL